MIFHPPNKIVNIPKLVMNNLPLEMVDNFVYLGITLNKSLSWKPHTHKIASKISKVNGILAKLKNMVPSRILLTIYNSLIACHLNYGILLWGKQIDQITKLQKKSMRLILNQKYNAHTEPIFKQLRLQKVSDIRIMQEVIFFYKFVKKSLPSFFSTDFIEISTTSTRRVLLHLPRFRHEYFRQSLRYTISSTINSTPSSIIDKCFTHSLSSLKNYIKNSQITQYSAVCNLEHCYVCNGN